ncbi:hypothetical protein IAT38_005360 [Cryptococcus sp. DSM 104549]
MSPRTHLPPARKTVSQRADDTVSSRCPPHGAATVPSSSDKKDAYSPTPTYSASRPRADHELPRPSSISSHRDCRGASPSPPPSPSGLPPGCSYGPALNPKLRESLHLPPLLPGEDDPTLSTSTGAAHNTLRVIWVDFPPSSPHNPFFFSTKRKLAITLVSTFFTCMTASNAGAYSIGTESMSRDLGSNEMEVAAGLGVFCFGFGITPMILAPLSEEFGRRWTYVGAVIVIILVYMMQALAHNTATMLAARILQGCAGSVGATLVGGTIADIYVPLHRGLPTAVFSLMAVAGGGFGSFWFAWVESDPSLEWRWIWWIQMIIFGALLPIIYFVMRETREPVILRQRAKRLRKERGLADGGRYTARSEVGKLGLLAMMRTSAVRPITFLAIEPVVTFFSLWIGVGWGVLFTQIGGLPYIFRNIYGFTTNQVGLVYLTMVIGALIGFGVNFIQDAIYRRRVDKDGIEARLYAAMVAGITLALGCFFYGFTSISSVPWIVPCIGATIVFASILTIYQSAFVYLGECYGSYASSAIAAQSFTRNMFGGAFAFFTVKMYRALTPRWTIFIWGCVALVLAAVPFVAYYRGPMIRAHSPYSKILMREEQERIAKEKEVLDGMG